ncbi:MAG: DUF721 domain-containing protein [Pseudomonadota bacterium]
MHHRRTRPVRRAPPKVSRAASDIFAKLARKTRYAEPGLAENWSEIAGAELASLGRPGRLTGRPPDRTLEIMTPDGGAAAQIQMNADALIRSVNRYLGPGAVARIAVRQRAAARSRQTAPTGDEPSGENESANPLGAALSRFRASVTSGNRHKDKP